MRLIWVGLLFLVFISIISTDQGQSVFTNFKEKASEVKRYVDNIAGYENNDEITEKQVGFDILNEEGSVKELEDPFGTKETQNEFQLPIELLAKLSMEDMFDYVNKLQQELPEEEIEKLQELITDWFSNEDK
ncbi:hypothetical protein [Alkalihalobacillus sp. LMS39]|uniref:hypothetical protein n=1 Tax=Alkalihalobacillus sp. LMS39 TaxID=2924032 RepID=UPI001FB3BEAA|nr:hypothetical protein [Alkalihalobacillus sp. LMS39]UOE96244.1 hypothetical protein MM271_11840 [Alkalihalobacillus sp. LMS39]